MSYRFIMTAFGKDRVGFVADVTRLLYENDCNLEDTSMNLLMDEFTLSLLFSCTDDKIDEQLSRECRRLEMEKGISAFIRPLPSSQTAQQGDKTCTLHIEGLDQSGIVYKTSQFLANKKMNILHLNSTAMPAPQSGATMYNMNIRVQVPSGLSVGQLEDDLGTVADELQVDISMSD